MDTTARPATRQAGAVDVWFDAGVWCADVCVGTAVGVVCSTHEARVREIVVRDMDRPHELRPVAVRHVVSGATHELTIDLTPSQVRQRRFPTRKVLVSADPTWWATPEQDRPDRWLPQPEPLYVAVAAPDLADGDVLVHPHAAVHVQGHHVGRLSGVQLAAADGQITAMIVDVGHHWHHRHVLVPAGDVEQITETVVGVRGSRQQIRRLAPPREEATHDLTPAAPHDLGIDDDDPDTAHAEAAHLVADGARHMLRAEGFTDDEIRRWADAYVTRPRSGDVVAFLDWIDTQEHAPSGGSARGR